ncbi:MAG: hypothetical protein M1820_001370 [Bogoriella megaspora]|nr:MAG: hypothetical protein M1820_001370 [Bogoriella megaspora]
MGCCGDREKGAVTEEQKWDYINLDDFKSKNCFTSFSYGWLWFLAIVGIAVYAVDTFTAVNLLAFDRWSSEVKPAVPFKVSKWIFAVCIMLSWILLMFEWIRAIRVIRRGAVAESYLDPLAVVLQSMRPGQGKGWRRFLVFAELTKSKKGVDYLALFVYFAFKGAIRILLAEAPRQFVNAVTLVSVAKADLVPVGGKQGTSAVGQFFDNIKVLANKDMKQAIILGSMVFTLVIWIFSALALIIASAAYIGFLWHYIPANDGRLSVYCRRKINRRVDRIVSVKVRTALEEQERKDRKRAMKEEREAMRKGERPTAQRQPTLPNVGGDSKDAKYPESVLSRQTSQSTLPPYSLKSRPTLPNIAENNAPPFARTDTTASSSSVGSDAPLLADAGSMGMSEPVRGPSPLGPLPERDNYGRPIVNRNMSSSTQGRRPPVGSPAPSYQSNSYRPGAPPIRQNTQGSMARSYGPPSRQNTQDSFSRPYGPPQRQNTGFTMASRQGPGESFEMSPTAPSSIQQNPAPSGFVPFNPNRSAASTPLRQPPSDYFSPQPPKRSATAPYSDSIYDAYGAGDVQGAAMPSRSATTGPTMRPGPGYGPSGPQGMGPPSRRPLPGSYGS